MWAPNFVLRFMRHPVRAVNYLDIGGVAEREREIILLEQTEMLTDSIDQVLTLRRLLHSATTDKRVTYQTHSARTPHGLYFDLLRISWSHIHLTLP